jgi:hypothetical protein
MSDQRLAPPPSRQQSNLPAYRPVRSPLQSMGPSLDEERRRHRAARLIAITSVVVVAAVVLLVWLVGMLGKEVVSQDATTATAITGGTAAAPVQQTGAPTPQTLAQTAPEKGSSTLRLQLPIRREAVTGIGFGVRHEDDVLELVPSGTVANTSWLKRATQRFLATTPASDLHWYRLDEGATSMVIVGALPGTEVYAPIDGKIQSIQEYVLDGEPRGHLIELQPTGDGQTVVVIRNLDATADIEVGQMVTQDVTRLGTVRDMEGSVEAPLASYTHDSGSGIDMYVLRLDVPSSSLG